MGSLIRVMWGHKAVLVFLLLSNAVGGTLVAAWEVRYLQHGVITYRKCSFTRCKFHQIGLSGVEWWLRNRYNVN
jgi:hypothetical protein